MIANLEFFEELLKYKEAVDAAIDQMMDQIALERNDEQAEIPLAHVISEIRFGRQPNRSVKRSR